MVRLARLFVHASAFCCAVAFGETASQKVYQTEAFALTNCNANAINSAVNCEVKRAVAAGVTEILGVEGYNLLTLEIFYDWSAGTGIQFKLQSCNEGLTSADCTASTDWYDVQTASASAGTLTLSDLLVSKAASADEYFVYSIAINYKRLRLASVVAQGSPDASDKATIKARLSNIPAF